MEPEPDRAGSQTDSRDLVAAAAVGIVSLDEHARIMSANTAALEMLLCTEAELVGLGAHVALNHDRPVEDCELESAVRSGIALHFQDDTFTTRDARPLPVWWAVNPLRDPASDSLLGAVLVFGDSTTQRAQAAADAAERAQGRAELAEAHQSIADLEWAAAISQVLSATLDEVEVMQRLARLTVGRLADLAVAELLGDDGAIRRVGWAVAEGIDVQLDEVLRHPDIRTEFPPGSATHDTISSATVLEIGPDDLADPRLLSAESRALMEAVGADRVLVVPLIARGHSVGGLGLLRRRGSLPFSHVDRLAAADVCLRAALAVDNAQLFRAQRDIATRLQHALLPALPSRTIVRAAVRYLPARQRFDVGGDWYDLFHAPGDPDTVLLAVGDVAGHDLAAGTTMSALRNLVRGISVATRRSPAQVLTSVDASFDALALAGTATAMFVEVRSLCGGAEGRGWELRWSNAGHMPMLLLTPDGDAELLDDVHGPLLGTDLGVSRAESHRIVPAGSTLVLYTDGLVETRSETIDAGLARLRATAIALTAPIDDPEAVADELMASNHASAEDDTAMLVCHLPDPG